MTRMTLRLHDFRLNSRLSTLCTALRQWERESMASPDSSGGAAATTDGAGVQTTWGPYDDGPISIESRFTCQGRERQDLVWKIYVVRDNVSSPLFNATGLSVFQLLSSGRRYLCVCVCVLFFVSRWFVDSLMNFESSSSSSIIMNFWIMNHEFIDHWSLIHWSWIIWMNRIVESIMIHQSSWIMIMIHDHDWDWVNHRHCHSCHSQTIRHVRHITITTDHLFCRRTRRFVRQTCNCNYSNRNNSNSNSIRFKFNFLNSPLTDLAWLILVLIPSFDPTDHSTGTTPQSHRWQSLHPTRTQQPERSEPPGAIEEDTTGTRLCSWSVSATETVIWWTDEWLMSLTVWVLSKTQ